MATAAEAWIDLLLSRSAELRRAGILSIGCEGNSAVLAPADPRDGEATESAGDDATAEPSDPWENPASYPTGSVPTLDRDRGEMPPIPLFEDG